MTKLKFMIPLFGGVLALLIPTRIFQLFFAVNPTTGFYESNHFSIILMAVLLVGGAVALFVLAFLSRKEIVAEEALLSKGVGVTAGLLALSFLLSAGYVFVNGSFSFWVNTLLSLVGFGSAAFFVLVCLNSFGVILGGTEQVFPFLSVCPILFSVIRLIASYMQYTTITNISEYLFDILTMVGMMLFYLANGRICSNTNPTRGYRRLFTVGVIAALLCGATILPRGIALLSGMEVFISELNLFSLTDLCTAAYIIALAATFIYTGAPASPEQDSAQPMPFRFGQGENFKGEAPASQEDHQAI